MRYVLDTVYLLVLLLLSPWLIYQFLTSPKFRRGLLDKLLGRAPALPASSRRAWFHGVSVGEGVQTGTGSDDFLEEGGTVAMPNKAQDRPLGGKSPGDSRDRVVARPGHQPVVRGGFAGCPR